MIRRLLTQLAEKDKMIKDYECELDLLKTGYAKIVINTQKKERCLAISAEQPMANYKTSEELQSLTFKKHEKSSKSANNLFLKYKWHLVILHLTLL